MGNKSWGETVQMTGRGRAGERCITIAGGGACKRKVRRSFGVKKTTTYTADMVGAR